MKKLLLTSVIAFSAVGLASGMNSNYETAHRNEALVETSLNVQKSDNEKAKSKKDDNKIYNVTEELPKFPGGNQALIDWIKDHKKYPSKAKKKVLKVV